LYIAQGVEYLGSADQASLLTKPLPLFYAAENIVKGVCLVLDPTLDALAFRAHGLRGDKKRRNSIKNTECTIEPPGSDVWSKAFSVLNADWITYSLTEDHSSMKRSTRDERLMAPLAPGRKLRLSYLLRNLPELANDVRIAGWGPSFFVPVSRFSLTITSEPYSAHLRFRVKHGHDEATKAMILDRERDLLRRFERVYDALDVLEYSIGPLSRRLLAPSIRCDLFGANHMNFARGRTDLSEILLYLAGLFTLSDVVRYHADQWARLLDDHPNDGILLERFLDLAGRKVPNLALNELERQHIVFKVGE
jgi:hypothetical protein